ncbi:unnamed protein product, partial [Porites lobata]
MDTPIGHKDKRPRVELSSEEELEIRTCLAAIEMEEKKKEIKEKENELREKEEELKQKERKSEIEEKEKELKEKEEKLKQKAKEIKKDHNGSQTVLNLSKSFSFLIQSSKPFHIFGAAAVNDMSPRVPLNLE